MAETSGPRRRPGVEPRAVGPSHLADVVPLRQRNWRQCALATFLARVRWYRESEPIGSPSRPRYGALSPDSRRAHPSSGFGAPDDAA